MTTTRAAAIGPAPTWGAAPRGAQPNYVHRCLSTLEAAGHLTGIVTQNVDGLHQAAGSRTVIPLHGDLATVICLSCGAREDRREYDARMTIANPGFAEAITLDPATINPDGDVQLADSAIDGFHVVGCARCGSTLMKPRRGLLRGARTPTQKTAGCRPHRPIRLRAGGGFVPGGHEWHAHHS